MQALIKPQQAGSVNDLRSFVAVDFLSYGYSHTKFSSAVIRAVSGQVRQLVGEQTYVDEVCRLSGYELKTHCYQKRRAWRILREFLFMAVMVRNRRQQILILGATGLQALLLAIFLRLRILRGERIRYIIHSELEGLDRSVPGLQKRAFRQAFLRFRLYEACRMAVLSRHVLTSPRLKEFARHLSCVDHPPPTRVGFPDLEHGPDTTVRSVAVVGLIRSDTKDLQAINEFARRVDSCGVSVCFLGRTLGTVEIDPIVVNRTTSTHYSEMDLEAQLEDVDAILCIHQADKYSLTASGGADDWLHYGKIGLFVDHPCFSQVRDAEEALPVLVATDALDLAESLRSWSPVIERKSIEDFHARRICEFEAQINDLMG